MNQRPSLSWHLPSAMELESIIDRSAYPTAIKTAAFTASPVSGIYWASTLDASSSSYAGMRGGDGGGRMGSSEGRRAWTYYPQMRK